MLNLEGVSPFMCTVVCLGTLLWVFVIEEQLRRWRIAVLLFLRELTLFKLLKNLLSRIMCVFEH